jgi:hypothetical protein
MRHGDTARRFGKYIHVETGRNWGIGGTPEELESCAKQQSGHDGCSCTDRTYKN